MDLPSQSNTLADLTACVRRTNGVRPPPLVGCSLTLIGDSVYLFGGRLVPTRTMVSTLYALNLNTLSWTNLTPPNSIPSPAPRYFHSAESWGNKIIIFGGEGYAASSSSSEGLEVSSSTSIDPTSSPLRTLGDLWIWDTIKGEWENPEPTCVEGVEKPEGRYAHLSIVNSSVSDLRRGTGGLFGGELEQERSTLTIIGGQDLANTYLHSVNVLDLDEMKWVRVGKWDKHIGTYRAVVATSKFTIGKTSAKAEGKKPEGSQETLNQISYSKKPTAEDPTPLFIFSNFNFTQVRRDLDLLSAPIAPSYSLEATSLSAHMTGLSLPPGLRFPTGTIIGHHLLIFGTFLSTQEDNFSIWALDLGEGGGNVLDRVAQGEKLEWMRVDPGTVLRNGSWNRAVCWNNTVVVLGDRERSIATDYNHRQTNFVHVAFVDLEAFAIYQPPMEPMSAPAQSFGLLSLAQPSLADFEIISSDGSRIGCSRRVLEVRWNWFKELVISKGELIKRGSNSSNESLIGGSSPQPDLDSTPIQSSNSIRTPNSSQYTSRTLYLPESSLTIQAFLQYLYTHTLCTSLQLSLPILTSLLLFSKIYEEPNLTALVVHALHETLSMKEGGSAAATIYNVAGVAGCTALQIRALRLMMSNPRVSKKPLSISPDQTSPDPALDEADDSSRRRGPSLNSSRSAPPLRGLRSNLRPTSRHGEISAQSITIESDRVLNYKPIMIPASPTRLTQTVPTSVSPHPRPREPLPHLPHLPRSSSKPEVAVEDVHSTPLPILISASRSISDSCTLDDLALLNSSPEVESTTLVDKIQNSPRVLRRSNSNSKKAAAEELLASKSIPRAFSPVEERQAGEFGSIMSTIPEGQKLKSHSGLGLLDMGYDVRMLGLDGAFTTPEDTIAPERPISNSSVYTPSVSPRQSLPSHTIGFDSRRYLRRHESSRGTSVTSGGMSSISSTEAGTDARTRQSSFSSLESSPRSPELLPVKESSPIQSIPLTTIKSLPPPPPIPIIIPSIQNSLSASSSSIKSSKKSKFSFLTSTAKSKGPPRPQILDADRPTIKFDSRSPTGMVIIRAATDPLPLSPTLLESSSISINSKSTSSSDPSSKPNPAFFPPRDTIDTARLPTPALMYLQPKGAESKKSLTTNIFTRMKSRGDAPFVMPTFGGY